MIRSGEIIRVRRGLYVPGNGNSYSMKTLANRIYGPSYISFEYALSYHNLIPERLTTITSASLAKNRRKEFRTPVGTFVYHSFSPEVLFYGVTRGEEDDSPFPHRHEGKDAVRYPFQAQGEGKPGFVAISLV